MKKLAAATALVLCVTPALALYKVVGPDGKVTYTDRAPADTGSKVVPFSKAGTPDNTPDVSLPIELRQVVARYPVTLFTSTDCQPCDAARALLQQRGVPYTEKRVSTEEDIQALERLIGGRSVPGATIGPQVLRGLNTADWVAYLDAAGYPKESRLPRGWQPPSVTPLVAVRDATPAAPARPAPQAAPAGDAAQPAPGGIKF